MIETVVVALALVLGVVILAVVFYPGRREAQRCRRRIAPLWTYRGPATFERLPPSVLSDERGRSAQPESWHSIECVGDLSDDY